MSKYFVGQRLLVKEINLAELSGKVFTVSRVEGGDVWIDTPDGPNWASTQWMDQHTIHVYERHTERLRACLAKFTPEHSSVKEGDRVRIHRNVATYGDRTGVVQIVKSDRVVVIFDDIGRNVFGLHEITKVRQS